MGAPVTCRGCGTRNSAPGDAPGALPEGWSIRSGSAYCSGCEVPLIDVTQRMGGAVTAAIIESCHQDPQLRASLELLRAEARADSPEFVQAVRATVRAACRTDGMPRAIARLFDEMLACASWVQAAEHVARATHDPHAIEAPVAPGADPFVL